MKETTDVLQSFVHKVQHAVEGGVELGNIVLNAGLLKYPNRATELYACVYLNDAGVAANIMR